MNSHLPQKAQNTCPHSVRDIFRKVPAGHPRLFITENNLQVYRDWVLNNEKSCFEQLLCWLKSRQENVNEPPDWQKAKLENKPWIDGFRKMMATGWEIEARLRGEAFAYLITENQLHLRRAIMGTKRILSWDPSGPSGSEMTSRAIATGLSMVYDWLYHELDNTMRRKITANVKIRYDALKKYYSQSIAGEIGTHSWTVLGLRGLAGLTLCHDTEWGKTWVNDAYKAFSSFYGNQCLPDGGLGCGVSYWVPWLSWPFQVALWALTGIDLLTATPYYKNALYFLFYQMNPCVSGLNFGDSGSVADFQISHAWTAEFLGRKFGMSEGNWWAKQYFQHHFRNQPDIHNRDRSFFDFYHLLWCGPGTDLHHKKHCSLNRKSLPLVRNFPDTGYVFGHSSWDQNDIEWGLRYGKGMPHSHADVNALVIHACGVPLLIDSGYYDYFGSTHHQSYAKQTIAHNTLIVDDDPSSQDWLNGHGEILHFEANQQNVAFISDISDPILYKNKLHRYTRSVIFLASSWFIVVDEVVPAGPHVLSFLFHSTNKIRKSGEDFIIQAEHRQKRVQGIMTFHSSVHINFSQRQAFSKESLNPSRGLKVEEQWLMSANLGKQQESTLLIWTLEILKSRRSKPSIITMKRLEKDNIKLSLNKKFSVTAFRNKQHRWQFPVKSNQRGMTLPKTEQ